MADIVTSAGDAIITNRVKGSGTEPKYISWGTGAGTAAKANTTLFTEAMSDSNTGTQNTRVTGTSTQETVTYTNDTYQVTGVMTADTGKTITNVGLFDTIGTAADLLTPPAGGNLFCKSNFTGIVLVAADTLTLTFLITVD